MRARRLSRRLVGLPLFLALVLASTPALAALTSKAAPPSAQSITSGAWRLVFSTAQSPTAVEGTVAPIPENAVSYVYLVNTGTDLRASYSVTVSAKSSDNAPMTLTACVDGSWTSASTCSSGKTFPVGSTSGTTWTATSFTADKILRAGVGMLPAKEAVQVRVQNTAALPGLYTGRTELTVSVAPR